MRTSELLRAAIAGALLWPAAALGADDCRARLTRDLERGTASSLSCFAPEATWRDERGRLVGSDAAAEGLKELAARKPTLPRSGLTEVRASTTSFFVGAFSEGKKSRAYHILAADRSAAGWTEARLYAAARPWPEGALPGEPEPGAAGLETVLAGFNTRFQRGDLEGWALVWHSSASWVSALGPFEGPEVRTFFERQSKRYDGQRLSVERVHSGLPGGGLLVEGSIRGRCRESEQPFVLEVLLLVRFERGLVRYAYEGLRLRDDGCGPFWSAPR